MACQQTEFSEQYHSSRIANNNKRDKQISQKEKNLTSSESYTKSDFVDNVYTEAEQIGEQDAENTDNFDNNDEEEDDEELSPEEAMLEQRAKLLELDLVHFPVKIFMEYERQCLNVISDLIDSYIPQGFKDKTITEDSDLSKRNFLNLHLEVQVEPLLKLFLSLAEMPVNNNNQDSPNDENNEKQVDFSQKPTPIVIPELLKSSSTNKILSNQPSPRKKEEEK